MYFFNDFPSMHSFHGYYVYTMLIMPDVQSEMTCFILSVRSSSMTSSRHEGCVCDECEINNR